MTLDRPPKPPARRCPVVVDGVRCPNPPHLPNKDWSAFCLRHETSPETEAWQRAAAASRQADLHQLSADALIRRLAALEVRAWRRDGEDVVTMSRDDAEKLIAITARARQLDRARRNTR